jgi:hypothetical protein
MQPNKAYPYASGKIFADLQPGAGHMDCKQLLSWLSFEP